MDDLGAFLLARYPSMPAPPANRASVRMAVPDDAAAIAAIYRPYVTDAATSFELDPPDAGEMARRMAALAAFAPWLVYAEATGRWWATPTPRPTGIARPTAGRSTSRSTSAAIATAAASAGRCTGRCCRCWRCRGSASPTPASPCPTPAASGCTKSLGFTPVGVYPAVGWKHGAWHDVGWWRRPLAELPAAPAPPLSLLAARTLASWPPQLAPSM